VAITGWGALDPLIAIAVAARIVWTGYDLMKRSVLGLMDTALPDAEQDSIRQILERHRPQGIDYHALRTRRSGARRFVSVHLLVPGAWTIQRGHDLTEEIETEVRARLPNTTMTTHLEPLEDPRAWRDAMLAPVRSATHEASRET
jgi:cation diffusion facilitator family transporter